METIRLTTAQAIIQFLKNQYVERDGVQHKFFAGCFGIFGHGNVAGIGQALQQNPDFRYYQTRNEQAMVHTAAAHAKMKNRLQTFASTLIDGPPTVTGSGCTISRLRFALAGDIFARRNVAPVPAARMPYPRTYRSMTASNPYRYWDRINRPEQILTSLPEALRVLTSPADTGAVTLALPQDVQTEAFDYPTELFRQRVWVIPRPRPDRSLLRRAAAMISGSQRPLIIAGGGGSRSK
jgi:3D-(3,5/4)-trihydroxycyclohexane-1,2-dione acylhydrolase (decyclizing)